MIRLQGLTEKIHPGRTGQILCAASNFVDYFEATVRGLAVSRCPLTLRRKKLYTQRRRGQCHIRKSSWQLPISIPLPTCRETKSKTNQGGIAHHGRFPPYLEKTLNNVEYTLRVMCLTLGLTRKQMIVEPAFKIIWHNDIFHQ